MKTKFKGILTLLLALVVQISFAQEKTVSGTVSDASGVLPGVSVLVKGTTSGTETDFNGKYSIKTKVGDVLSFSYVGYKSVDKKVSNANTIDVVMQEDAGILDEVVITALGIKRDKKSLGYSTQEVKGDKVSGIKSQNFVNSLSGKVAGLDIKSSGNLGGSTNVVIRGNNSIAGNNQALFVVDGVPVDNGNSNSSGQQTGRGGYDYGNAASDINPDDIESINVLKGAAATALYGSRASNGVIMITTKKGTSKRGIGVTINSSITSGTADKSTLVKYQNKYGAGYGPYYDSADGYFNLFDVNGDGTLDLTTPFTEDASYGAAFNPNLLVYQWNSIYPQLSTYQQATPWLSHREGNDPNFVWGTSITAVNSFSLDGGNDTSAFRLGVTNLNQEGNLPNSLLKRNTISFNGSHNLSDKFKASSSFNFIKTSGKGRNGTGYDSNNVMQQFRQWFQMNVDLKEQRDAYFATGDNITWNPNGPDDLSPIYSDNPYWTFYENYETDTRSRFFGNLALDYEINDWLNTTGKFSFDTYSELQEERTNVGSANVSSYSRFNNNVAEYNWDFMLNFNKNLTDKLNLEGNIGVNIRRNVRNSIFASTNGGLNLRSLYSLSNSVNPINAPTEYDSTSMVDGEYIRASLGYDNFAFVEGSYRTDRSSTLPKANNRYGYFSISGSLIFSQLIKGDWLNFGKLRANYAEVGSDTNPYRVFNTFGIGTPFNGNGIASNPNAQANLNLLPERQESYEIGLEMSMFDRRVGVDISYYNTQSINQITSIPLSTATGYTSAVLNAGTIENKGWEVQLNLTPLKSENFQWDITTNWAKNESLVVELLNGIKNLQIAALQGGISINATPGQPYGTIRGSDFIYAANGGRIVNQTGSASRIGTYQRTSDSNQVIGDINPDWKAGVFNTFRYKNFSLGFLIDIQKGGNVFSLDTWYGYATGMYDWSAQNNELGNPIRDVVTGTPGNYGADSGGLIVDGVAPDGTKNEVRANFDIYANPYGYARAPNALHVYDAGYIKLREASITYNLDKETIKKTPFTSASISIIGRNLWIINKSTPYSDPEAGLSSGNIQGYQSGAYPSIREVGASVKLQF
ncbi:MAG: SusC/RagA family TonB-linked outer membrane protein [Flavobacteriia bacterium]|nr:SusC/RagA family TonB-linked outer membrane protein [Flavobacteriia bacterium]OIP46657.1 MAG: SusC/RagA family protein [Flavobacteriaceae bacterium CG2_30_31_66]PIV97942.1 MAG: SusC/RagA family TonB-linked outer membrane protein [Flavobacteriaceae bacterium CG17_big_fil_post_rev_8_21_14_2_50_31_13]PIX11717.1 MAG: SusC/RagA family TonB-linked outer membrane protein [Flavobacteriaceae bacterium CG_4_8_14_3_um_filter_31_8]PIY16217.1 MAG: SusC/RagA family TonB-linked outer membrane protein [Flav